MADEVSTYAIDMQRCDLLEEGATLGCEHCEHDASILGRGLPDDQVSSHQPIEAARKARRRQVQISCEVAHSHL